MIVEFVGAPGSGKSTLLPSVQQRLRGFESVDLDSLDDRDSRWRWRFEGVRSGLRNPALAAGLLPELWRTRDRLVAHQVWSILLRDRAIRRLPTQQVLLDEGAHHRLLWLAALQDAPRLVDHSVRLPAPDLLVNVEVPDELAVRRARQLGKVGHPYSSMDRETALEVGSRYRRFAGRMVARSGVPVVTLAGAEDVGAVIEAVHRTIAARPE